MIETRIVCDQCGKVQENADQMWAVGLFVSGNIKSPTPMNSQIKNQIWCRDCLDKRSMTDWAKEQPHPEKIDPPPTFAEQIEYLIREMINEEFQNQ